MTVNFQIKDKERLFFDNFASDGYEVFTPATYDKLICIFKDNIKPKGGERVLDLGCGSGAFSSRLEKLGLNVFGVDISFGLLDKSKYKDRITFILADIESLPLRDNSFDIVVFSAVLHHFPSFDKVVKEAQRVLKDSGRCFAFDPNNRHPIMWLYRNKKSPFYSTKGVTENERLLNQQEIYKVFGDNGFKARIFAVSGLFYRYINNRSMRLFLPVYNFVDGIFAMTKFARTHGSFLITLAQK